MTQVSQLTQGAVSAETLRAADYREIFQELRTKTSLRRFADFIGSGVSFAWWGAYERGEKELSRERCNELRRAVGLAELPATVGEALAGVDPDATVYGITSGDAGAEGAALGQYVYDRVVMVGRELHAPLTLRLNGSLEVLDGAGEAAPEAHVTPVTRPRTRRPTQAIRLSPDRFARLQTLRQEAGMTWNELADWVAQLCGV